MNKKRKEETPEEIPVQDPPKPEEEVGQEETQESDAVSAGRDLAEALAQAEAKRDEYLGMAQRVQADFENYRRRNVAAVSEAREEGIRQSLTAFLHVLDSFERALGAAGEEKGPFRDGVELICRQMKDTMTALGLEEIDASGVFDPNVHHAVMQSPADEDHPAGSVVAVLQKGYTAKGRVLRPAMVQVAQ